MRARQAGGEGGNSALSVTPPTAHLTAARCAFDAIVSDLPIADGYKLSVAESARRSLPRVSDTVDLTYGDVPFDALANVLAAAAPRHGGTFVDLGSGMARGVLAAALLCGNARCLGIELLADLHAAALGLLRSFEELHMRVLAGEAAPGLDAAHMASCFELQNDDIFLVDLSALSVDVVFCCCVTWSDGILQRLATKLAEELPDGARVITVARRLPALVDLGEKRGAVRFDEVHVAVEELAWGREAFIVHRVVRVGELVARRHRKLAQKSKAGGAR